MGRVVWERGYKPRYFNKPARKPIRKHKRIDYGQRVWSETARCVYLELVAVGANLTGLVTQRLAWGSLETLIRLEGQPCQQDRCSEARTMQQGPARQLALQHLPRQQAAVSLVRIMLQDLTRQTSLENPPQLRLPPLLRWRRHPLWVATLSGLLHQLQQPRPQRELVQHRTRFSDKQNLPRRPVSPPA